MRDLASRGSARWFVALTLAVGACVLGPSGPSLAAGRARSDVMFQTYRVIELGSFGGTNCCLVVTLNDRGWVDGTSDLPGDQNFHPFLWVDGRMTDLGTLGGPNASVGGMDELGDVTVGGADTGISDPLGEDACFFGTHQTCLSYVWRAGARTPVPTLGGNNDDVSGINDRGQVLVAAGETAIPDPTCVAPQVLGWETYIWDPRTDSIQVLAPLRGDSDTGAFTMNELGQVAGWSGGCGAGLGDYSAGHRGVLWRNGKPTVIPSLGGFASLPFSINDRTQITGASDVSGKSVDYHAFLWTPQGGIHDLGTLPGDTLSIGDEINDAGQVAAQSCDNNGNCRAALWEKGVMVDLNALVNTKSSLYLLSAGINAKGELAGTAFDQISGTTVPFLAVPDCRYLTLSQVLSRQRKLALPDAVRSKLMRERSIFERHR